jgi:competence ComEA-like helix-hairpin-helix protein
MRTKGPAAGAFVQPRKGEHHGSLFAGARAGAAVALGGGRRQSQHRHERRADRIAGHRAAKAQAIVDYRKANGAFKTVEELKDVKGIGAKRFEKLKGELTVGPAGRSVAAAPGKADARTSSGAKGDIRTAAETPARK